MCKQKQYIPTNYIGLLCFVDKFQFFGTYDAFANFLQVSFNGSELLYTVWTKCSQIDG